MAIPAYDQYGGEQLRNIFAGWMVSGDLDQLALDYILYFERRRQTNEPTVYLEGVGDKGGADIEDDSYLSLFTLKSVEVKSMTKKTKSLRIAFKLKMSKVPGHDGLLRFDWINDEHWIHCYMLVALIKYKRLESLVVERAKMDARWRAFLMGTHTWAGRNSPIRRGSRITWIQLKMIRGHMGFEDLQVF